MNDTTPEIEQKQFEIMMGLGPERRIELACEMYMAARASVFASIPANLTSNVRRRKFIEKMYGEEFSDDFFKDEVE